MEGVAAVGVVPPPPLLLPPHPMPAVSKARQTSMSMAAHRHRRVGMPIKKMHASNDPPLTANHRLCVRRSAEVFDLACGAVVFTVRVAVWLVVELLSATEDLSKEHEIPVAAACGGTKEQARSTVPLKPVVELTVTVDGPESPAAAIVIGVAETV
jgi:hypothetical protein